ncbi:TrkA C-terminal domain-containing protein [Clostridium intestinale]|uniref:TrkA C-terminal domain-containing protein n=1 Tax=Clostridium intestinale TaxID=36845 RepID=UPI002DD61DB1|nr:TrkA C-terminal domain-containing protein [Clostridium intestinale]WRY51850.1 TrkA C-terminal domain-containing protein [Clostridium intestinale]
MILVGEKMKEELVPIYKKIALDIASKIVRGEIQTDKKISGRSTLAGLYNVSPETIRRAIALLEGMEVVKANPGSGIQILSVTNAERFISSNQDRKYISSIREDIVEIINTRNDLDRRLEENLNEIYDYLERFKSISPFLLIEIPIKNTCKFLEKSVNDSRFWQNTGATIVAYRRNKEIIVSPGPNYTFIEGDIIVVIGKDDVFEKVNEFLYE